MRADRDVDVRITPDGDPPMLQITTPRRAYPAFRPGLAGAHQVSNATGAIRLLETLEDIGIPVGADAVVTGLATVVWPGRLDLVPVGGRGAILLDAAHNPAAAAALAAYLRGAFPAGLPIVFGVMDDKDVDGIVTALAPCATGFVCTAPDTPRAIPAAALAARVQPLAGGIPVTDDRAPWRAVEAAWRLAGTVCVTGSVFLVGEVLAAIDHARSPR